MKKIFLYIIGVITCTFLPFVSHAEVYINEIMYDVSGTDSGREWVEIFNAGSEPIDVSKWKFLESASASNHSLTQSQGVSVIPVGGFAIISSDPTKFLLDYPSFSGNLFKASFSSLNNTEGTLFLKNDSSEIVNQVTYNSSQGASGDGNSLQKSSSTWIVGSPTPGLINTNTPVIVDNQNSTTTDSSTTQTESQAIGFGNSAGNTSAHSSPVPLSNSDPKIEFEISAGRDRLTSIGSGIVFLATPTRLQNMSGNNIIYDWSFGDGTSVHGNNLTHTYKFAGEYSVVVNASFSDAQAVSRIVVKVINPKILLNRVSGGLEISNNSGAEINLEGWKLQNQTKPFIFPKDTLIPNGKKVVFADEVTEINSGSIRLENPLGKKYAEIFENPTSATLQVANVSNTDEIVAGIKKVTEALAVITPKVKELNMQNEVPIIEKPITRIAEVTKPTNILSAKIENVSTNSDQLANTVTVFEAPEEKGLISSIFSWPIAGINFIKNLFVEK